MNIPRLSPMNQTGKFSSTNNTSNTRELVSSHTSTCCCLVVSTSDLKTSMSAFMFDNLSSFLGKSVTSSMVEINTSQCERLIPCDTVWVLKSVDVGRFMMLVLSVWLCSSIIVNPSPISNDKLATPYFYVPKM
jgi:hypothetical protein